MLDSSRRFDLLMVGTSSRMDKVLGAVITVVLAGISFLHQQMEKGNAQLKEEMKVMGRKIDAGNAQLKVDLVKALKWNLPFVS